jgi:hypothetical protein
VDEAANQLFFRIDRDIALTKKALSIDQAFLAAINSGAKDICKRWAAAAHALDDTKKLKAERANAYRAFLHGYKLVRGWLLEKTSLKQYPWVKDTIKKSIDPWMEDVLKRLEHAATP